MKNQKPIRSVLIATLLALTSTTSGFAYSGDPIENEMQLTRDAVQIATEEMKNLSSSDSYSPDTRRKIEALEARTRAALAVYEDTVRNQVLLPLKPLVSAYLRTLDSKADPAIKQALLNEYAGQLNVMAKTLSETKHRQAMIAFANVSQLEYPLIQQGKLVSLDDGVENSTYETNLYRRGEINTNIATYNRGVLMRGCATAQCLPEYHSYVIQWATLLAQHVYRPIVIQLSPTYSLGISDGRYVAEWREGTRNYVHMRLPYRIIRAISYVDTHSSLPSSVSTAQFEMFDVITRQLEAWNGSAACLSAVRAVKKLHGDAASLGEIATSVSAATYTDLDEHMEATMQPLRAAILQIENTSMYYGPSVAGKEKKKLDRIRRAAIAERQTCLDATR